MVERKELLKTIVENTDKSKEEIEELVVNKVNELSGLVSEEGALYIIANELGVKLESNVLRKDVNEIKINEITEPKVPASFVCKVIGIYDRITFTSQSSSSEGSVQSILVGDETAVIRVVFWNDKTKLLENFKEKDVLRIINSYTRENANSQRIEVHFSQYSDIEVNPEGVSVDVIEYVPQEVEFSPKKINELEEGDRNIHIEGVIANVEVPRFYLACPKTFKKVFQNEGKYISPSEGEVEPIKVPIVNFLLDDGSGTIPVVGFRDRAEASTGFSSEELVTLSEDIEKYRTFSKKLVGSKVRIGGNIGKNNMNSEKQLIISKVLGIEFKSIDDIADELSSEDDSLKKSTPNKKVAKKESFEETNLDDDIDLDIEEIDIED